MCEDEASIGYGRLGSGGRGGGALTHTLDAADEDDCGTKVMAVQRQELENKGVQAEGKQSAIEATMIDN